MQQVEDTNWSKACREHLKKGVNKKTNNMIARTLDAIELAYGVDNDSQIFQLVRGKVLGILNDEKRDILDEIDQYVVFKKVYTIEMPFIGKEIRNDRN